MSYGCDLLRLTEAMAAVGNALRLVWKALAVGALACVLVVLGLLVDSSRVSTAGELADVRLGLPFDWVHQDQSWMDPPAGSAYDLRFRLPQENPTQVSVGMFAANLALASVAVVLAWAGLRRLVAHLARQGAVHVST
ncbi:hypothetical protein [Actinopolymorpha alba]|uniref:hypothetical protein n=1 Tax=Actinopolymorpha alba TaxID=533267 RepID=UPI000379E1CA|nr:hypothetical protein [Actinopolymorpha alba]